MSCDKVISLEVCPAYVTTARPGAGDTEGVIGGIYETVSST